MKNTKTIIAALSLLMTVQLSAYDNITKDLVHKSIDDREAVEKISAYLKRQYNRKTDKAFGQEWRQFNYTPDMFAGSKQYSRLGFMPHKTSLEMKNVPIGIGFETLDRDTFDPLTTFDYLCEAGVKYARCQTGWWKCERTPGKFDFKWLDDVVDGLKAKDITTWFSLSFGHPAYCPCELFEKQWEEAKKNGTMVPGWGRGWVGEAPYYHGDKAMKAWLKYVHALAVHFKGRVSIFEVWNEPEYFWRKNAEVAGNELFGDVQAAKDFADFVKITAAEVRKVIPDAKITFNLAGFANIWYPVMAKEGISDVIDFYNYHSYSRFPEEGLRQAVEFMRAVFVKKDGTPVPIWQGESGRASGKSALFAMPTEYSQAKFITRRITSDIALGCEVTSMFTVADFLCYYPDGSDQYYGIWNTRENKPKLGWYALQTMTYLMEDIERAPEFWCSFTSKGNSFSSMIPYSSVEVAAFKKHGIPIFAFWQKEHIDITPAPVPGDFKYVTDVPSLIQHPIIIDPVRGEVWDAKNAYRYRARGIEGLEIWAYDYPLFVTDLSFFSDIIK